MSALFGTQYFGFIAGAYGATVVVLMALIIWVLATYRSRKATLAEMEAAGLRRAAARGNDEKGSSA